MGSVEAGRLDFARSGVAPHREVARAGAAANNTDPTPLAWKATADQILAKVRRAQVAPGESRHPETVFGDDDAGSAEPDDGEAFRRVHESGPPRRQE